MAYGLKEKYIFLSKICLFVFKSFYFWLNLRENDFCELFFTQKIKHSNLEKIERNFDISDMDTQNKYFTYIFMLEFMFFKYYNRDK